MMNAIRRAAVFMTILFGLGLGAEFAAADVWVKPHTRNGKQVKGHYRSSPNKTTSDNFSTRGNQNPYTKKWGKKNGNGTGAWTTSYSRDNGASNWTYATSRPGQPFTPREDIRMNALEFDGGWICFDGFEKQGEECVPIKKRTGEPSKPQALRIENVTIVGGM